MLISIFSAVSSAIAVLLRELDNATEGALATMSRTNWGNLSLVSGQSAFADDLMRNIENVIETVKPLVEQRKYLRNFFDKAARYAVSTVS